MFLRLTEHPFHLFPYLTPFLCAFHRNKEEKIRIKQFGQQLKKLKVEYDLATKKRGGRGGGGDVIGFLKNFLHNNKKYSI